MNYSYDDENEIDLIELCHNVLKKWRVGIVAMRIGAVLMGAFSVYKQSQSEERTAEEMERALNECKKELTDLEISEVDTLVEMYGNYAFVYDEKEMYGQKSIYLNIDPEHVYSGTSTYVISNYYDNQGIYTVENTNAGNIVALYSELLTDDKTIDLIKEATGWDVDRQYVRELYGVSSAGVSLLRISTIAPTEEECRIIISVLEDRLEQVKSDVIANAPHDIVKVNDKYFEDYSNGITDAQKAQSDTLISLKTAMRNIPNNLTAAQKSYYTELLSQLYPDEVEEKKFSVFALVKYVIIGMIAGAFLIAFWYAFLYVLNQTLRTKDDITDLFGERVIGVIKPETSNPRKRAFSGIDCFIEKIFDKRDGLLSEQLALEMISSEITVGIEKGDIKKPFITSTCASEDVKNILETIRTKTKCQKELTVGKSVLVDSSSLKNLSESDGVIFVEKILDSKLSDIAKELELCKQYGVKVLGTVVVK